MNLMNSVTTVSQALSEESQADCMDLLSLTEQGIPFSPTCTNLTVTVRDLQRHNLPQQFEYCLREQSCREEL